MAIKRSPIQRLIDNAQRRIRRIVKEILPNRAKNTTEYNEKISAVKENLESFVKDLKRESKIGKVSDEFLYEKEIEFKSDIYSTSKKKLAEIDIKELILKGVSFDIDESVEEDFYDEYKNLIDELIRDSQSLDNIYIGISGDAEGRATAMRIIESIDELEKNSRQYWNLDKLSDELVNIKYELSARLEEYGRRKNYERKGK